MDNAQRLGWLWCELMEIYGFQNKAGILQYPEHQPSAMVMNDTPRKNVIAKNKAQIEVIVKRPREIELTAEAQRRGEK